MQVGHNALGAGQIIAQGARLVDQAVGSGDIFKQQGWQHIKPSLKDDTLHFIGLLSDGGVHSRYDQLLKILQGVFVASNDVSVFGTELSAISNVLLPHACKESEVLHEEQCMHCCKRNQLQGFRIMEQWHSRMLRKHLVAVAYKLPSAFGDSVHIHKAVKWGEQLTFRC